MTTPASPSVPDRITDKMVLLVISGGLIVIILSIVIGLFLTSRPNFTLPNWAENVLVSIATATALKLGDALSTLVALSGARSVERLGNQLANAGPSDLGPSGTPADPLHTKIDNPPSQPANVKETKKS